MWGLVQPEGRWSWRAPSEARGKPRPGPEPGRGERSDAGESGLGGVLVHGGRSGSGCGAGTVHAAILWRAWMPSLGIQRFLYFNKSKTHFHSHVNISERNASYN